MPAKELFTMYGISSGTETSNAFIFRSDAWNGWTSIIRLPKGCVFKVWEERITGPPTNVYMEVSYDTGSTYLQYAHSSVGTQGVTSGYVSCIAWDVTREGRPAHIINSDVSSNTKIMKWRYEQGTASTAQLMLNCEIDSDV